MALPPTEELSRWTVNQVTNWLTKCSLSAFRDDFISQGIDGSKLLRLKSDDIDMRYKHVPPKKRNVLNDHLSKVQSSRSTPSWQHNFQPAPRRLPPATPKDESYECSDDDSSDEDDNDYIEPTSQPVPESPVSNHGHNSSSHGAEAPDQMYEIPDTSLDVQPSNNHFDCKPTIDRLKDSFAARNRAEEFEEDTPPPRPPPRSGHGATSSPSMSRKHPSVAFTPQPHFRAPPPPPAHNTPAIPEGYYEAMGDVITENRVSQPAVPSPVAQRRKSPIPERKYQEQDELSRHEWYHGEISRKDAEKILEREQMEGMFLIRKSERHTNQPYTLVLWYSKVWNLPIRKKDNSMYAAGKFKPGETEFSSVPELVEHFKKTSLNLKSETSTTSCHYLTQPAPKY